MLSIEFCVVFSFGIASFQPHRTVAVAMQASTRVHAYPVGVSWKKTVADFRSCVTCSSSSHPASTGAECRTLTRRRSERRDPQRSFGSSRRLNVTLAQTSSGVSIRSLDQSPTDEEDVEDADITLANDDQSLKV